MLANGGSPLHRGILAWWLTAPDGSDIGSGEIALRDPLLPGTPRELARIELSLPSVDQALACRLTVTLTAAERKLENSWPLWIYPPVTFDDAALYDPAGALDGFEPLARVAALDVDRVLIAGGWSREIAEFVRSGGQAIVLQSGDGALPVARVPFWRELIKLLYDHPALRGFPHAGYADMQFYSLATDAALDGAGVAPIIGGEVRPILRRLDARLFTLLDYLLEVRLGSGRLLISTLRFQGGAGDQVRGLRANPAGAFLLRRLVDALLE